MAGIPPFNANQRIPNDPFYNPNANRYNLSYPTGQVIFGPNFYVDYTTGLITVSPVPPNNGTVKLVVAGTGLETSPIGGITTTGSVGLKVIPTVTAGPYTYPTIAINQFGKVTLAVDGTPPVVALVATSPLSVTGTSPSINLGIRLASTSSPGAVQLVDGLGSTDRTRALTSLQGFNLGTQMSFIGNALANQQLAGTVNVTSGNISYLSPDGGAPVPPFILGTPLPAAVPAYDGYYFYTTGTGTYTPPGGTPTACVPNDKVICINGAWVIIQSGLRLVPATTTTWGITTLATGAEVQALTLPNKAVSPGSLSGMVASETQVGFVELATDAETQAFTDNTRAVTPDSLGSLQTTTTTRGLVLLTDSTANPLTTEAPTANALKTYHDSSLGTANVTAQGDLIVGLDYQTPFSLPLGTVRSQLTVDTTKPLQGSLDWTVSQSLVSWPVGAVIWHAARLAPTALWLECDGRLLDASPSGQYYELYSLIGTTYNKSGDPAAGFFRIPDLRGVFVRGYSSGGPNPTPTALDPGRTFASTQSDEYKQHFHTVTDPGHIHQLPLTEHAHPTNSGTVTHSHGATSNHCHAIGNIPNSEVVGDQFGYYDGNAQWGAPSGPNSANSVTNASVDSKKTGLAVVTATTGLSVNTVVTSLTVDNSPPSPPYPDESRPYNIALLPMIKFRSP